MRDGVSVRVKSVRANLTGSVAEVSQWQPLSIVVKALETNRVYRAPGAGRLIEKVHHLHGEQLVRHSKIYSDEPHRLGAFQGNGQLIGMNFECQVTPVQTEGGERGILHRR